MIAMNVSIILALFSLSFIVFIKSYKKYDVEIQMNGEFVEVVVVKSLRKPAVKLFTIGNTLTLFLFMVFNVVYYNFLIVGSDLGLVWKLVFWVTVLFVSLRFVSSDYKYRVTKAKQDFEKSVLEVV